MIITICTPTNVGGVDGTLFLNVRRKIRELLQEEGFEEPTMSLTEKGDDYEEWVLNSREEKK